MARDATPDAGLGVDAQDPLGLAAGERVSVTPADYGKVPVTGTLVTLDARGGGSASVKIRRSAPSSPTFRASAIASSAA